MPYKVFVAGEEALAADVNSFLMSQTVPRFTNATQRTSQLTAPVLNQLSILDSRPGVVQYWTGSAWADSPSGQLIQSAGQSITLNTFGQAAVTFPVSFPSVPNIFIVQSPWVGPSITHVVGVQGTLSATGCNIQATNAAGAALGAVTLGIWWLAIGVRA